MIENILSRLEKVRPTGRGSWLARCPAHEDRSPSFSITEKEDGRIVCKCFAACSFEAIVAAVGLDMDEWFPPKAIEPARPARRPFPAADVLSALADEVLIVAVIAADMHKGRTISEEDYQRLFTAAERILEARSAALGN